MWRHQFSRAGTHYVTIRWSARRAIPRVDIDGFLFIGAPRSLPGGATNAERAAEASAAVGGVLARARRCGRPLASLI